MTDHNQTNLKKFSRLAYLLGYIYARTPRSDAPTINPLYEEAKQILQDISPMFAEPKPSASFEEWFNSLPDFKSTYNKKFKGYKEVGKFGLYVPNPELIELADEELAEYEAIKEAYLAGKQATSLEKSLQPETINEIIKQVKEYMLAQYKDYPDEVTDWINRNVRDEIGQQGLTTEAMRRAINLAQKSQSSAQTAKEIFAELEKDFKVICNEVDLKSKYVSELDYNGGCLNYQHLKQKYLKE